MPKLDWRELAAIFAGGFLGALARVLLVQVAPVTPGSWPWATFVANVAGTLLLGYFVPACRSVCRSRPTGGRCSARACAGP
jgi:fluoride ion exporter CrcB/FEX